ncbi:cadherin-like protein 26 [Triplophysa rosa]|uniref:Cadherin-like protein 26 n=1 Tax=Triplophysa rosa TaxID=992332 RepID=A0A9W7TEG3_TRIRA|nr:cadherin-like protein 26 [Triplophysa rosa]KAI7794589.1 putative cadherin-like protein 26 [Triplophysa rosa]
MRTLPVTFLVLLFAWTMHTWADTGRIRQKRAWIIDSFSIEEENPGPFPYKLGKIELDRKYLVNFVLYGQGVDEEPKNILTITKDTGEIYVHGKVDYESITDSTKALKLRFEAVNRSNNAVDTRLGVEIKILDINDNPPIFQQLNYDITVEESHAQGDKILTVLASDKDDIKTPNGTFSFTIKSVIPKTDNVDFYIQQSDGVGMIYFKGCLDYEKAQKYTILVEAKDHGEAKKLSSTSTVRVKISDKNNHLPVFSGQTGSGKVKERDIGTEVLRLQVSDKDSPGSKAWKAKYTIQGETKNIFKIETDPTTNEGILTVVKAIDYEEQTYQNLSISVQNEAPYFSCTIKNRPHDSMWELDRFFETPGTSDEKLYKSIPVTIYVEDVNDPPVFIPLVTDVTIRENTDVGTFMTTVTAVDSDGAHGNTIRFVKGKDDADWITVDEKTGKVSVAKIMDRESVENSTYTAIVYAVDDGEPPLTGTGTVRIHLQDLNDNVPLLTVDHINMCLDKEPTTVNITAVDLDLPPYSSPFYYELLGDVEGKWRIDPAHGTTVDLVKESNVYSGHHFLQIRIADQQGFSTIQNLSVTVCNCASDSSCHERMVSKTRMGSGGTWAMILAVLFLAVILLMAFLMTCKTEKKMIPLDDGFGRLITTNTEIPGTDCMVPFNGDGEKTQFSKETTVSNVYLDQHRTSQNMTINGVQAVAQIPNSVFSDQMFQRSIYRSSSRRSYKDMRNYQRSSFRSTTSYSNIPVMREKLFSLINQRLLTLQTCDEDHDAYQPHCYAHEGEFIANADLDTISIAETDFLPETLNYLDYKFNNLATICSPPPMKT